MTTEEYNNTQTNVPFFKNPNQRGRMLAGLIVVTAGAFLLLRNIGTVFPEWLFTWQMFLIVLGFYIGAKHSFKRGGWWIVSLVGVVFILHEFIPGLTHSNLFWPVLIIIAGLSMIISPNSTWSSNRWRKHWEEKFNSANSENLNTDDFIDSTSIFGGVKKNIISKNFKGGDIVCIFGGSELNLMQADINGRVVLDVVQIFGGTKLLVPAHWEVIPEMMAILGGIEDKRPPHNIEMLDGTKVLVIKGTSIFGGIDIRSY